MTAASHTLERITQRFAVASWAQPVNAADIRQRLMNGAISDDAVTLPPARYPEVPLREFLKELHTLGRTLGRQPMHRSFQDALTSHIAEIELRARVAASDDDDFRAHSLATLDGLPTDSLLTEAWSVIGQPVEQPQEAALSDKTAATHLRRALDAYRLDDWTVERSAEMTARMSVNGPLHRVRVRAGATFTTSELQRLLVHEIGGHVLRRVNSERQDWPWATTPLGRSIPTEEGLALWWEEQFTVSDPWVRRIYAARVVAVDLARSSGALEVARTLSPYVGPASAADLALRSKRGLINLDSPGGTTKDWSYLGGLHLISRLADQDAQAVRLLSAVKWSADHLGLAQQLLDDGLIREAVLAPDERLFHEQL